MKSLPTAAGAAFLLLAPALLAAQVGHAPGSSPYSDIRFGKSISVIAGDMGGDGGQIGVAPHDGHSYAVRADLRLGSGPITFGFALAHYDLKRMVVDLADTTGQPFRGPVKQTMTTFEASLQFTITGRKTWHGLAPYVAGSVGYLVPSSTPSDSSGYSFGSRFFLAPSAGLRIYPFQRVHLLVEARQLFWKVKYPIAYIAAGVIPGPRVDQWTGGREFRAGLGIGF